jgi:capsule polysaccharide export protein KpsE/RkpR
MVNFSIRCSELIEVDVNKIKDRINSNNRKLGFLKNSNAAFDLQKAIEMDQKLLERIEGEKGEIERVSAKLDYMEKYNKDV